MSTNKVDSYLYSVEELASRKIKYILSIGKRQPMHIGHKNSLARILAIKDTKLIYVMGSSNLINDPLFDPVTNPLNIEQQIKQFQIVFPKANPIFLPIIDIKNMNLWGEVIISSLANLNIRPEECAIHFIGKEEDKLKEKVTFLIKTGEEVTLQPGQWLIEALVYWGFYMWFDQIQGVDLTISAREFRGIDLENLSIKQSKLLAAPDYLKKIAKEARKMHPQESGPITLFDLTIERRKGH